jgi:hypothetical protein
MARFWVYVAQVNQQRFEVIAPNEQAAAEKGYRMWRREFGHSSVTAVEKIDDNELSK